MTWTDTDPVLVQPYGTKPFFYRVRVADPFGNLSAPSAVISGTVPDITAPGPTELVGANGGGRPHPGGVEAQPRTRRRRLPDLPRRVRSRLPLRARDRAHEGQGGSGHHRGAEPLPVRHDPRRRRPAGRRQRDVEHRRHASGSTTSASPRPRRSATATGSGPTTTPATCTTAGTAVPVPASTCCARLREKTPPPAPVMTGLRARNNGVLVEWMGSPVQDLRAFHVYRSDAELDPPPLPRLRLHRRDGQLRHRGGGCCRPATTCRPYPTRSRRTAPTSTPRPSRTTCTGTGSLRSTGSATRATGRPSRTSPRAARSPTPATCP